MTVKVEGVDRIRQKLEAAFSPAQMKNMMEEAGYNIQQRVADHISRASVTRHKTADALGAKHTKYLEFSPGRVTSASPAGGNVDSSDADEHGVTINVRNTPGLRRAWGDLHIKPVNAKYLTIPTDKDSYGRRAREFDGMGRKLFCFSSRHGNLGLYEKRLVGSHKGKNGKDVKEYQTVRMYALVKSVTVPQDAGLMPKDEEYQKWAKQSISAFMALHGIGA